MSQTCPSNTSYVKNQYGKARRQSLETLAMSTMLTSSLVEVLKELNLNHIHAELIQELARFKQMLETERLELKRATPLNYSLYSHFHCQLRSLIWSIIKIRGNERVHKELPLQEYLLSILFARRTASLMAKLLNSQSVMIFTGLIESLQSRLSDQNSNICDQLLHLLDEQISDKYLEREEFLKENNILGEFQYTLSFDMLPIDVKALGLIKGRKGEVTSAELIEALNRNVEIDQGALSLLKNSLRQSEKHPQRNVEVFVPIRLDTHDRARYHLRKAIQKFAEYQGDNFQAWNLITSINNVLLSTYDNASRANQEMQREEAKAKSRIMNSRPDNMNQPRIDFDECNDIKVIKISDELFTKDSRINSSDPLANQDGINQRPQKESTIREREESSTELASRSERQNRMSYSKPTALPNLAPLKLVQFCIRDDDVRHKAQIAELSAFHKSFLANYESSEGVNLINIHKFEEISHIRVWNILAEGRGTQHWKLLKLFEFPQITQSNYQATEKYLKHIFQYLQTRLLKQNLNALYISVFVHPSDSLSSFMNGDYCLEFESLTLRSDLHFITFAENQNAGSSEPVLFYINKLPPDQFNPFFILYFSYSPELNVMFQYRHRSVKGITQREKLRSKGNWKPANFLSISHPSIWTPKARVFTEQEQIAPLCQDKSHSIQSYTFKFKGKSSRLEFRIAMKRIIEKEGE